MNNRGVTLVTVVVMIILMIIIVTVSIVAGNRLIVNSKEYSNEQEYESVKAAVRRKKTEVEMAGSLIPIGESYIGIKDPILKSDGTETIVAKDWYLLDEENLEKLGIYDVTNRYLVNYDYEAVLSTKNTDYIEEYMLIKFIYEYMSGDSVVGIELRNKTTLEPSAKMVKNNETGNIYGTGWYLLKKAENGSAGDFGAFSEDIKNNYLINFKTKEYIKLDSNFEEI